MPVFLPKTEEALADLISNNQVLFGDHLDGTIRVGQTGQMIGYTEYDAEVHDPLDIDNDSELEEIFDEPFVQEMLSTHGLDVKIAIDATNRLEIPSVTMAKFTVASYLASAIENVVPNTGDRVRSYLI